jgi:hypothetical protein
MYQDYIDDIIKHYQAGKKNGDLPLRLIQPTPGNVKEECLSVCETRFQKKDLRILTAFFKVDNDQAAVLRAIHRCDRDRFKPLANFLKGITNSTDDLNIELLAWLIDFPNRPFKAEEYAETSGEVENIVVPEKKEVEGNSEGSFTVDNVVPEQRETEGNIGANFTADNVVQEKKETEKTEGNNEANLTADNKDTDAGMTGPELTKVKRAQSRVATPARYGGTWKKVIAVIISGLLVVLLGFYLVNTDMSSGLPDKRLLKTDDTGTSVVSSGREAPVGGTHTAGSDLTTEKGSLSPRQQAQEAKIRKSETVEKREPEPAVVNLVSSAVDFASFTNPESNADIALLIIDNNRKNITGVASAVANLYRNKSYSVSTSVFTYAFINSKYVDEVAGGDISILSKLALPPAVKYIVVGKYTSSTDNGQRTRFIYRAGLDVTIISVQQKMQVDGFELTVSNGYDDEEHARAGAIEKLIDQYQIRSTVIKLN